MVRWEWRPGSTPFLAWRQDRFNDEVSRSLVGPRELWDSFGVTGNHILMVKASYWLSVGR